MSATTATAKERPILFKDRLVRSIFSGVKKQARRVVTPQPFKSDHDPEMWLRSRGRRSYNSNCRHEEVRNRHTGEVLSERQYYLPLEEWLAEQCPYGQPGDRLWVRETAYIAPPNFGDPIDANARDDEGRPRVVGYAASMGSDAVRCAEDYGIRKTPSIHMPRWASRLTLEITKRRAERLQSINEWDAFEEGAPAAEGSHVAAFAGLWDSINARRGYDWEANPWVWVIGFRRIDT